MADAERGAAYLNTVSDSRPAIVSPLALRERVEALWKAGLPPGDRTGWPSVDKLYTVVPGQLTVVTGWPSSGKSEWLDAMLVNLGRQSWKMALFSPENQPTEVHATKLIEKLAGKPFGNGARPRIALEELPEYLDELDRYFAFIVSPKGDAIAAKAIIEAVTPWMEQHKGQKRGLVIDPWNELDHWRPSNVNETEYISQTLSILRAWARANAVHVWIVAHPQKMHRDPKTGKLPIPRPDMISGSQHWWNKADCAITVWRDLDPDSIAPNEVEIHVQKCRFKHVGKMGLAVLTYDRVTGRYSEGPNLQSVKSYRDNTRGE